MSRYNSIRKPGHRREGKYIYILTEGEISEPLYLNYIKHNFRIPESLITIKPAKAPQADKMINELITLKDNNIKESENGKSELIDVFWAVFDTENNTSITRKAIKLAKKNDINVAISSVSFEIWLLLHFTYTTKYFTNSKEVIKDLQKYLASYSSSHKCPDMNVLYPLLSVARTNSKNLRKDRLSSKVDYTFTDIDILVDSFLLEADKVIINKFKNLSSKNSLSFNNILDS